jgi:uncharacterized protein YndB with AHSA1/START domain
MPATWGAVSVLDQSPERVWEFIASDENDVNWRAPWLRSVRRLSVGALGPGARYESAYRFFGRDETVVVELTEVDPPRRMAWRQVSQGSLAVNDGRYELEPIHGGTRFRVTGTIASPGWRRLFDRPFAWYLNRAAQRQHRQLVSALRAWDDQSSSPV